MPCSVQLRQGHDDLFPLYMVHDQALPPSSPPARSSQAIQALAPKSSSPLDRCRNSDIPRNSQAGLSIPVPLSSSRARSSGEYREVWAACNSIPRQNSSPSRPQLQRTSSYSVTCQSCGTGTTPQWRTGPDGFGTLCNFCGLMWRKKQMETLTQGAFGTPRPSQSDPTPRTSGRPYFFSRS